jgi:D-alanine-D-alanine ligase
MDDSAVVTVASAEDLEQRVDAWSERLGRPCFAEDYVDGREFNLSVLAGAAGSSGPQVLPPAEIDFSAFPENKPRIVGYKAKWEAGSFEYEHTPRRFAFPQSDGRLLDRLRDLALGGWAVLGLAGYARVDFRVDRAGEPWILEINANPCLSPDAGFAAALEPAGLSFDQAIERILQACEITRSGGRDHSSPRRYSRISSSGTTSANRA